MSRPNPNPNPNPGTPVGSKCDQLARLIESAAERGIVPSPERAASITASISECEGIVATLSEAAQAWVAQHGL